MTVCSPADQMVGANVRRLRTGRSVGQSDLAKSMKISEADLRLSEAGTRRFRAIELFAISQILEISVSDLFRDSAAPVDPGQLEVSS